MENIEVPEGWSQLAVDILASKYFRRAGVPGKGFEDSIRQVIGRITRAIRRQGEQQGLLSGEDARVFEAELQYLLLHQMAAFNSPVWFNVGLFEEYGIRGGEGGFRYDPIGAKVVPVLNAFEHPQASACFIQSVEDDLMSVFDLAKNEARLFKYGSGTGTNFSKLRGKQERLSGGGFSSGLLAFLEVLDRGAGATKSGGTTRRAAKMVCLDMDHPEILDFIRWKAKEEAKAKALIAQGYSPDFNGEAYRTVSGQNSNNSVRIRDEFLRAVLEDGSWETRGRTDGSVVETFRARAIWREIAEAAWACADPGIQFDSTIQAWHTCKTTAPIRASNPCSEFMFLDDTACNLASLNLLRFLDGQGGFDAIRFCHAIRILLTAQEILVGMSGYPTESIARNSHRFRPLGLGYANLGALLMSKGIPYDSREGRELASAVTALLTGEAYSVSAEIAAVLGHFEGFTENRESMLGVIERHVRAADDLPDAQELARIAKASWKRAWEAGKKSGFRNAQVTVLAPTGTIGLLMDCDTTGIEPDFALVKFKKLAGGGALKIVNRSVEAALRTLGYRESERGPMMEYLLGTLTLTRGTARFNAQTLTERGLRPEEISRIEAELSSVFHLADAFSPERLGVETLNRLGIAGGTGRGILKHLGFSDSEIEEANEMICGLMTLEGAPGLQARDLAVFDCANRCGPKGARFIAPHGHLAMMAAVQPFLSGAISKTVNLPESTTVGEVEEIHLQAWKMGLKSIAIYRDGCKASQPLGTSAGAEATPAAVRHRLPVKRKGITIEAVVGERKIYLRTGEYADGKPGELFLDLENADPEYRALLACFSIAVSLGLQYGIPLEEWVRRFAFTQFEPAGVVQGHPNLRMATSLIDYVFRTLGVEYLGWSDLAHVPGGAKIGRIESTDKMDGTGDAIDDLLRTLTRDAPECDSCGHKTVRAGACFRCLHCGSSMGCG